MFHVPAMIQMQIAIHSKHVSLYKESAELTVVEMESQFFCWKFYFTPWRNAFSVNSIRMFVNTTSLKRAMFWGSPGSGLRAESASYVNRN